MKSPCGHEQATCVIGNYWECPVCNPKVIKSEGSIAIGTPDYHNPPQCEAFITEEALQELEKWFDSHSHVTSAEIDGDTLYVQAKFKKALAVEDIKVDFYADDQGNTYLEMPEVEIDTTWAPYEWFTVDTYEEPDPLAELPVWAKIDDMAADPDLLPALHQLWKECGFWAKDSGFEGFTNIRKRDDMDSYEITVKRTVDQGKYVVDGNRPMDRKFLLEVVAAEMHSHMCSECDQVAGQAAEIAPAFRTLDCADDDIMERWRKSLEEENPEYARFLSLKGS